MENPWEKDYGRSQSLEARNSFHPEEEGGSESPLFCVTQSRNWKLARNCMHTVVLASLARSRRFTSITNQLLRKKYQKKIRSMSQQDLFQHRHEDTNHYLFLEGLTRLYRATSKVDIRPNRAVSGGQSQKMGWRSREKSLVRVRGVSFIVCQGPFTFYAKCRNNEQTKRL